MARIKVLELPSKVIGELIETPFALIIDQVEREELTTFDGDAVQVAFELTQAEADQIARSVGARGAVLTACTLDLA